MSHSRPNSHNRPGRAGSWLGSLAGRLMGMFGRIKKPTIQDVTKMEFPASTQRMGVRFTERIRAVFRHIWLKKH